MHTFWRREMNITYDSHECYFGYWSISGWVYECVCLDDNGMITMQVWFGRLSESGIFSGYGFAVCSVLFISASLST